MSRLPPMTSRLLTAALAALLIAGCGVGTPPHSAGARLNVTSDFGTREIGSATQAKVTGNDTDLSLLAAHHRVKVAPRTGRLEAIGVRRSGPHRTWSLFVNGVAPGAPPGKVVLNPGDSVWYDLRDNAAAGTVRAVVGSFPEPFTTGIGGQAYPTVMDCSPGVTAACDTVESELNRFGVKVSQQALGEGSGQYSLAIVIGTYSQLRGIIAAELLEAGPAKSGVYGQFVGARGQALELDNANGLVTGTLRGSVGLIAASQQQSLTAPTWMVTGTDPAGVAAAARALNPEKLKNRYAVALAHGKIIPLPTTG